MKALVTILIALACFAPLIRAGQDAQRDAAKAEAEIWRSFNRLRTEFRLPPVSAEPRLDAWARLNSQARAKTGGSEAPAPALTSLPEAAAAADRYFAQTTTVELMLPTLDLTFLRESLINESSRSGRRLWPEMDVGGIGVFKDDGARLHTTLALLRSWTPQPASRVRSDIIHRIGLARRAAGRKPLAWKADYQAVAQEKAEGKPPGDKALARLKKAEKIGSITILTTSLEDAGNLPPALLEAPFLWAGLGVWIGRLPEYPGGCCRLVYVYGTRLKDESHVIY
jgi:uncharacterized protein YkwD